jgi:hypothetical protein
VTAVPGSWRRLVVAAVSSVCVVVACRDRGERSRAPMPPSATAPTAPSKPRSEPRPDASAHREPIVAPMPDGCFASAPTGSAETVLDFLVRTCAPGTAELLPEGPARAASRDGVTFRVDAVPTCLRAFVVARSDVPLRATLQSPGADVLAHSELPARFAVLAARGPVCVSEPGTYRIDLQGPDRLEVLVSIRIAASASP